jgi:hypothetical protein
MAKRHFSLLRLLAAHREELELPGDSPMMAELRKYRPSGHKRPKLDTPQDVLALSEFQLMELFEHVCYDEAVEFQGAVARLVVPGLTRALDLFGRGPVLSTGIPAVDKVLGGGFHCGQVVELVGRAGVGKTQWSLTMCARVALQGRGVIYVDTEGKFSPERLVQILRAVGGSTEDAARVRVIKADGLASTHLVRLLKELEASILDDNVGLIVCDSIAANVRAEYDRDSLVERQKVLAKQASQLKTLAETFVLPVLVVRARAARRRTSRTDPSQTNQVLALSSSHRPSLGAGGSADVGVVEGVRGDEGAYLAALGNTWAHCVNVRLALSDSGAFRILRVAKSPTSREASVSYAIAEAGIVASSAVEELLQGLTAEDLEALAR